MNKDPAFLFYPSDFLVGTMLMSNEEVGKYIKLLAYIHTKGGSITEKEFFQVCNKDDVIIIEKFKVDGEGNYYNERLLSEIRKRSSYTESRRNNRLKATNDDLSVYLIKNNVSGLVKIGSSNNPKRRLIELQNANLNEELQIIAIVEGVTQKIENKIQKQYKHKNVFNEWFNLDDDDIKNIIKEYDMSNHMILHMSNHMENENINVIINKDLSSPLNNNTKKKKELFIKPTLEEINNYILENNYIIVGEEFYDYYESNGWLVGKNKMKNWKATVNNWNRKEDKKHNTKQEETSNPFLKRLKEIEKNERKASFDDTFNS